MIYIEKSTNRYPVFADQIKALFPEISFPKGQYEFEGFDIVYNSEIPDFDPEVCFLSEGNPVEINGKFYRNWIVNNLSEDAILEIKQQKAKQLQAEIVDATQERLDSFARTRNYDGILSACTYATSNIPKFAAEGQSAVNLRDATWAALYQILEEVQAGQRETPSGFSDIEPLLPPLEWPV